jgi:hypothetical protein
MLPQRVHTAARSILLRRTSQPQRMIWGARAIGVPRPHRKLSQQSHHQVARDCSVRSVSSGFRLLAMAHRAAVAPPFVWCPPRRENSRRLVGLQALRALRRERFFRRRVMATMLDQMTRRLQAHNTFEAAIECLLDDVIALHGAEFGDVQISVADELVIVAQRGLSAAFLNAFRRVGVNDGCACGRALRSGQPIVVEDVMLDDEFKPFRSDALAAGYRGVQSTPLFTRARVLVGVVSTLFANPHAPSSIEMETLKAYSGIAADHVSSLQGTGGLASNALAMSDRLYSRMNATASRAPIARRI